MKRFFLPAIIVLFAITACNNSDKKNDNKGVVGDKNEPKTQADSLMADVMDGHDVGMAKYGKLTAMQNTVQAALDSIAKLPAKAQQSAAPYKTKLEAVSKDLNYALTAMDKWMNEFNMDSAVNNMQERVKYLTDEKWKVGKIKDAILGSLDKADSVLRSKF